MRYKKNDGINYDNLIYYFKGPSTATNFTEYKDPSTIYDKTKNGVKTIQAAKEKQVQLRSELNKIARGNPEHKSKYQSETIKNVQNLDNLRQKFLDFF